MSAGQVLSALDETQIVSTERHEAAPFVSHIYIDIDNYRDSQYDRCMICARHLTLSLLPNEFAHGRVDSTEEVLSG